MQQKNWLIGAFLTIGMLFTSAPAYAAHVFVSTTGSDENNGTQQSPLQTIEAALQKSKGGDTIYVLEGIYNMLTTIDGYSFSSPVTITPYNGQKVVIDGAERDESDRTRAAFSIRNSQNIIIDGFEIRNITTDDDEFFPAGILVRGHSENITIRNNHIHHIANNADEGNAHGILVYGNDPSPMKNIVVTANVLHNLTLGSSESLTINGNVDGFEVSHNRLYDNNNIGIDIAGYYGACTKSGCIDVARNGEVSYNNVMRHSSLHNPAYRGGNSAPGIYVDGGQNIQVRHNFVAQNNFGISVSSENKGKYAQQVFVSNNMIVNNDKAGVVIGGSTVDNGGIQHIVLYKNSLIRNDRVDGGYKEISLQQHIYGLVLIENRYQTASFAKRISNNNKQNVTYNTYRERRIVTSP